MSLGSVSLPLYGRNSVFLENSRKQFVLPLFWKSAYSLWELGNLVEKSQNFLVYLMKNAQLYFETLAIVFFFFCFMSFSFSVSLFWAMKAIIKINVWWNVQILLRLFYSSDLSTEKVKRSEVKASLKYCVMYLLESSKFCLLREFPY